MRSFFKTFSACILAFLAINIVGFMILVGLVSSVGSLIGDDSSKGGPLTKETVLHITFEQPIKDAPMLNPLSGLDLTTMTITENLTLLKVITAIEAAKMDPNIKGIFIEPGMVSPSIGMASMKEIRNELLEFKKSGKFIVAYADAYSQGLYYLSSVADKITVNPMGLVELKGMAMQSLYFKGTLEKFGVRAEVIKHGTFKSAVEPFTNSSMSDANRAQTEALLGSLWGTILDEISESRSLDREELQKAIDNLEITDAESALDAGVVDYVGYRNDVVDFLKEELDVDEVPIVSLSRYAAATQLKGGSDNKVAVVYAEGDIIDGKAQEGSVGSVTLSAQLRKLRDDEDVKAVVLRVNSPGGSVLASDVIWNDVKRVMEKKPLIVSMGDYAASGGYYISAPADAILASPTTITGSIGVFGLLFNAQEGLKDYLGITSSVVKTAQGADFGSPLRPMSEFERRVMQKGVDKTYETFVGLVSEGRNLTLTKVDSLAEGRVWSGSQALESGLIDGFGGIKHAIVLAAEKAGVVNDFSIEVPSMELTSTQQIISALLEVKTFGLNADPIIKNYLKVISYIQESPLQARMPYILRFE